jgi:hypothetical protein
MSLKLAPSLLHGDILFIVNPGSADAGNNQWQDGSSDDSLLDEKRKKDAVQLAGYSTSSHTYHATELKARPRIEKQQTS